MDFESANGHSNSSYKGVALGQFKLKWPKGYCFFEHDNFITLFKFNDSSH